MTAELEDLIGALDLLSLSYADQRAFLPASGYSEDGVLAECVEGLREAMWGCPTLLRQGLLDPEAAAALLDCTLRVEALMRDSATRTPTAFATHPEWERVRTLAARAFAAVTHTKG